jgi:type VI secretion system secreted protein Hcp
MRGPAPLEDKRRSPPRFETPQKEQNMPMLGTIAITGANQGNITAGANTTGSIGANAVTTIGGCSVGTDVSLVTASSIQITVPTNPQTGQVSGSPIQMPSTFTKYVDKASPLLWAAITGKETLTDVELNLFETDNKGNTTNSYTIKFASAVLVAGNMYKLDVLNTLNQQYSDMETFSFTYAQATWTHNNGGTSGSYVAVGSKS